jgi:hypothetical protein
MDSLHKPHLDVAHKVLRYIKSYPGWGIFFSASPELHLKAFCDSDWVGYPDSRKSVIGGFVFF